MKTFRTLSLAVVLSAGLLSTAHAQPAHADAQMQAVLDELGLLGGKPIPTLTAEQARHQPTPADAVMSLLRTRNQPRTPEAVGRVEYSSIPGPGGEIPVKVYTPAGAKPASGWPLIVYYHGGGWVIATFETYDASARALANGAQAVVVAVEYRKGPEHKFPAAHDDAYAAYTWALANAAVLRRRREPRGRGRRERRRQPRHDGRHDGARPGRQAARAPDAHLPDRERRLQHALVPARTPTPSRSTSR